MLRSECHYSQKKNEALKLYHLNLKQQNSKKKNLRSKQTKNV